MEKEKKDITLVEDYNKIINYNPDKSVVVKTEWTKMGDSFSKLSLYDNSYTPISTLGNTTLFKP